jgi:putative transposase
VRVYRDALGHWYVSFVVQAQAQPLPETGAVLGVDWGVKEIATTTSPAHDLPHPQFGTKAAVKLARYQRQMARRKPKKGQEASAGYKRAKRQAAKTHAKVANQRQEKFTMARKAADASIGAAKRALVEMAAKHGRAVHLVNPAYTTMDCSACGARAKTRLLLSERTFTCGSCGTVLPRDRNSAAVMLARAGLTPAGADRVRRAAA